MILNMNEVVQATDGWTDSWLVYVGIQGNVPALEPTGCSIGGRDRNRSMLRIPEW